MKKSGISIFFPVYNDWGTIASLVVLAMATVEKVTDDYEVILVDDGSEEKTQKVLEFLEKKYPAVRVVHHPQNRGYGAALRTGFASAQKEWIFYTDGDAQYDPSEMLKLIPAMTEEIAVVNGYKIKRNDPWYRTTAGKLYHYIAKIMFALPIRDVDCDFRLIRKSVFDRVQLKSNSGVICVEMVRKISAAGFKFAEAPVSHYFRLSGKSQFFNCRRLFHVGIDISKLWWQLVIRKTEN